jgi:hypothetical protein
MQIFKKSNLSVFSGFSFLIIMFSLFFSVSVANASVTPTLTLAPTGNGDSVQLNISGDPNSSVTFFYSKSGSGQQVLPIGTTNANGNFSTTISSSQDGIVSGSSVYITTGGMNGAQSASVAWPAVALLLSSSNMLSLSQTGLVLTLNQSTTITASNLNSSSLYQSNNSNPAIANFSISGSQITVLANSYGTTTGTFCLTNNTSNCGSVYVIVQNSSAQPMTFSQSSISLSAGQTVAVQISGGSGTYSVINNASQNGGVVTTNISGTLITLTTASTTGSSSITVCSTDMTSCGIINVTIGNTISSAISFSQSNPTIGVAQSLNVNIYGPSSSLFYVSSNLPSGIVQANLSGSVLTLVGITNGSSTISVCASSSNCASLVVTVSASSSGGLLTLSQQTVNLSVGQTSNVTISGGTMPYSVLPTSNNVFQATLNSNIITLVGSSAGSSLINVCSATGNCVTLSITVGPTSSTTLPNGCYSTIGYSQITGALCSSSVTNPVVNTVPVDCTGALYSISTGQACPASTVITTPVAVSTPTTAVPATSEITTQSTSTTSKTFVFTKTLKLGSTGTAVIQLQKKLKTLGFYTGKADGGYGVATEKAVKAFQKAHKLPQVGSVGPQTRALLNK